MFLSEFYLFHELCSEHEIWYIYILDHPSTGFLYRVFPVSCFERLSSTFIHLGERIAHTTVTIIVILIFPLFRSFISS
jgi:hypothetical protein